jgi:hypothetical protein
VERWKKRWIGRMERRLFDAGEKKAMMGRISHPFNKAIQQ